MTCNDALENHVTIGSHFTFSSGGLTDGFGNLEVHSLSILTAEGEAVAFPLCFLFKSFND